MTLAEAIEFLRPAVDSETLTWADLGAGSGTFTEALAHMVGPSGTVFAVDHDPVAATRLRALARNLPAGTASVVAVTGDVAHLSAIPQIAEGAVRGALLANVLHYFREPVRILEGVARITSGGRAVIVEYDRASNNRWVPYPISPEKLQDVAGSAGFESATVVAERRSQFGSRLYCAVLATRDAPSPA